MPATATMPAIASYFTTAGRMSVGYAETLVKDIPAAKFGHMPHPNMNHPAFVIGHLSLYPNRLFTLIGCPELIIEKPGYAELFAAGVQCVEQDGRYPGKDELVSHFMERSNAALAALATVSDDVFARENPIEGRMKERFPLVGHAVNFLLNNHAMMHLGQVSAWRRAMGMGSAM